MKNVIVTLSKEKDLFDVGDKNIIYIFKDVDEYEEEINGYLRVLFLLRFSKKDQVCVGNWPKVFFHGGGNLG